MAPTPLYGLRSAEVFSALETSPSGLKEDEIAARRSLYGPNLLSQPVKVSSWARLIAHLFHPMAILLWVAGFLAIIAREPVLGVVIWALVLVNAGFSFWREY